MFYKEKDLVVSATRHPKPISQVAENITVVTSKEIEEMNAHSVAEVLNRIPGLFVVFSQGTGSFGSASMIKIQGSETKHVLVQMDGVAWNFLSSGAPETNSIPVGIIDRIEVIKGPASSVWGSALGGVVNIITKTAGTDSKPAGSLSVSYGEKNTQDYRAEILGKEKTVGYYLYAGRQYSEGQISSRDFNNHSLYSKFHIPISEDMALGLSMGYSDPKTGLGNFSSGDLRSSGTSRTFFATASLDASLASELNLNISFHHFKQRIDIMNNALGLGIRGTSGELFSDSLYDEKTTGGSGKLVWAHGEHTVIFGVDADNVKLDQTFTSGTYLQSVGAPATLSTYPDIDQWAVYANDTIVIDRLSITPGIRYDHNSITGSFTSPSLGIAYQLGEDSIARASVARGFTIPPLSWTSGGGLFLDPNSSLKPEKVWSYQAGVESTALRYLWAKATVFHHEIKDILKKEASAGGAPAFNDLIINTGTSRRQGIELETETISMYNLSLRTGFAYVDINPATEEGATGIYTWNIGLKYDDRKSFRAQIYGHYVWWDLASASGASYDDFIWDFNLKKNIYSNENIATDVFLTAHNIFNGSQYVFGDIQNPERWVEAGLRFSF
ncbi:MAG: TonB-dependent receptor [Proteobacteria bacterium]|nr:TonB-dependent receptor [Pseudomonadota bacterium]MBU4035464.1 TonB-dependent receptor [Pseudomonadota bacterium]